MKTKLILLLAIPLLFAGCKKKKDNFHFEGTVQGYVECSLTTASISEQEFGYVVSLTTPDSIGGDYAGDQGKIYHNCVILYHTRARFYDGDSIRGTMYLDEDFSRAYCAFHFDYGIPQGVCYSLDR